MTSRDLFPFQHVARATVLALMLASLPAAAFATESVQAAFDADEQFRAARDLAFAGQWETAAAIAERILEAAPDYADVTVFLARIRAWQHDYPQARTLLAGLLERDPDHVDVLAIAADVGLWSVNPTSLATSAMVSTRL